MLREKKILDFKLNHIIYMSVGPHLNEDLDSIMIRKSKEIEDFEESLWAFNSGIAKSVYELCNLQFGEDENIYCVMVNTGKDTKTGEKNAKKAKYYIGLNGEKIEIKKGMDVTFANNGAYALLVEEYYKIIGDNIIDTKEYEKIKFVRGFGLLNKKDSKLKMDKPTEMGLPKKVSYIAKLKKPFLVKIFTDNSNDNK